MTMKTISVSQAKATLSEHIRRAQRGESVVITDRGRAVARLVAMDRDNSVDDIVELERTGLLRRPHKPLPATLLTAPRAVDDTASVRAALIDERRHGR